VAALEDQDFLPRPLQIRGVDQPLCPPPMMIASYFCAMLVLPSI